MKKSQRLGDYNRKLHSYLWITLKKNKDKKINNLKLGCAIKPKSTIKKMTSLEI